MAKVVVANPDANRIIHEIDVDFGDLRTLKEPIHVVQYDNRTPLIETHLFQNGEVYTIPEGASCNIRWRKPDNLFCYNPALGCNSERNTLYFEITSQMTLSYGDTFPIVEIELDNSIVGSSVIPVVIERNPIQQGDIESTIEYITAKEYAERAEAAAKASTDAKEKAEAAQRASEAARDLSQAAQRASEAARDLSKQYSEDSKVAKAGAEAAQKLSEAAQKLSEAARDKSNEYATKSESYAHGKTGSRPGEDADNSETYKDQAEAAKAKAQELANHMDSALEEQYTQLVNYFNTEINKLIGGAPPEMLDTIAELAQAYQNNKNLIDQITQAIGGKADDEEFTSHIQNTTMHTTTAEKTKWNGKLDPTGNGSNLTNTFTQATTRANLSTGEKLATSLGKIAKWFADLKNIAFSGNYTDLTGAPTALKNPKALTFAGSVTGVYDGSEAKTITITMPTIPTALKNPKALKFTGASTATYDGSTEITVNIPSTSSAATTAEKLKTPRGFQTNLASTAKVNFDGSADNIHGVTGVLPLANGGFGNTTGTAQYLASHFIAANTDLNNLTTPGFYYCPYDATVATLGNRPTTNAFGMIVNTHAGLNQLLIEYMTSGFKIYTRNEYHSNWSSWVRLYTTIDKPSASDVGALPTNGKAASATVADKATTATTATTATKLVKPIVFSQEDSSPSNGIFVSTSQIYGNEGTIGEILMHLFPGSMLLETTISGDIQGSAELEREVDSANVTHYKYANGFFRANFKFVKYHFHLVTSGYNGQGFAVSNRCDTASGKIFGILMTTGGPSNYDMALRIDMSMFNDEVLSRDFARSVQSYVNSKNFLISVLYLNGGSLKISRFYNISSVSGYKEELIIVIAITDTNMGLNQSTPKLILFSFGKID